MSPTFSRGSALRASAYDRVCGWVERRGLLELRRGLVAGLEGDVVELGAGTGLTLPFYPPAARVVATEYDPIMLDRAVERARSAHASVSLAVADAMRLPLADDSVDTVVICLMLCSVPDPRATLCEIRRVLRAGGRLRCVEHVRAPDGTRLARVQDRVNPLWRRFSGGCNANRRTAETIEEVGFGIERVERRNLHAFHVSPHVLVEARNP